MASSEQPISTAQLARLIQSRVTLKVLGEVADPVEISEASAAVNRPKVLDAVRAAGWAPFHYDRAHDGLAEPWRAHVLWHQDCQQIAANFHDWFDDIKPSNKLPKMLSACGALVLVTWIPQFQSGGAPEASNPQTSETPEKQRQVDEEHLAASAAMVQNLLLMLSAESMGTYWSSGGTFRTPAMFDRLGIPTCERLLAAVFVEFPETTSQSQSPERLPGKQRTNRSENHQWMREVEL